MSRCDPERDIAGQRHQWRRRWQRCAARDPRLPSSLCPCRHRTAAIARETLASGHWEIGTRVMAEELRALELLAEAEVSEQSCSRGRVKADYVCSVIERSR